MHQAVRGIEPRLLDSESRVLTARPYGRRNICLALFQYCCLLYSHLLFVAISSLTLCYMFYPDTRNRTRDHSISLQSYSRTLYQLSYVRLFRGEARLSDFALRRRSKKYKISIYRWRTWASIPVPLACLASALPFELDPRCRETLR